jgi:hypothetical protein
MRLVRAAVVAVQLAVAALTITLALAFPPSRHPNPSVTIGNLARGGLAGQRRPHSPIGSIRRRARR